MRNLFIFISIFLFSSVALSAEKVTLHFWHSYAAGGFYKELSENFTKQHPNIKIITTNYPTDDLKSTIVLSMFKNEAPDMVLFPSDLLGYYKVLKLGEVPAHWFNNNTESAAIQATGKGNELFGIPLYQGNHLMLYYNKSLVDTPATTWLEMANQVTMLEQKGVKPLAMRVNKMYWFISFLNAYNGFSLVNDEVVINELAMKKALKAYKFLLDKKLTEKSCDFDCTNERFFSGEFAYSFNGIWSYRDGKKRLGDNFAIAALPTIDGLPLKSMRSTTVLAFPNNSLHSEKAQAIFTFSNYLQSEKVQRHFYQKNGQIPVDANLVKTLQLQGSENQKIVLKLLENTFAMPTSAAMSAVWPGMALGVELYLAGELTADKTVIFIQKKIEHELYKIKQLEGVTH
ncbi:sugar ABC transporter substrate-binding protein [Colwellia sp. 12G3]|uniref:sugar ABC transporter substrate-binding protein n=1 Tax=Colwellia sp. 12G3 TaxID=2058299 RepID=UPI000C3224BB|nr:extracellular solute-binding protein [Colwellia sp. 12G3]PKI12885.1 hypothetical protein CXF71_19410 [Colwellia sp. 12G3]